MRTAATVVFVFAHILLLSGFVCDVNAADQLVLVQAAWRNGDRNPTKVCKKDPYQADSWTQGLGWLSDVGMRQHFDFGSIIYDEYVKNHKFLNAVFDTREVYFYSADTNRTLLSAQSHALGMYYNRSALVADVDFPASNGWPHGYVPVPVHTDKPEVDYVGNMASCKRSDYLIGLVHETEDYKTFAASNEEVRANASTKCGESTTLQPSDVSLITHSWMQENSTGRANKLFTVEEFLELRAIEKDAKRYKNGKGNLMSGDINLSAELPMLRSGSLLWNIIDHIHLKIFCLNKTNSALSTCTWMNQLKYYTYSIKCDTLYSLFEMLDSQHEILGLDDGGHYELPDFTAALVFELWLADDGSFYIKVQYYSPGMTALKDVTTSVDGCKASASCAVNDFEGGLSKYKLTDEIAKLCNNVPATWVLETETISAPDEEGDVDMKKREAVDDDNDRLVFIQSMWRHGDRTPLGTCPNDALTENDWKNGFGQLTAVGMEQHRKLGAKIYEKYVEQLQFLSPSFRSDEIYIHSTGFNRTMISVMSNFIGMYYNRGNVTKGVDYPDAERWPPGFVPVPVHNYDNVHDHMGDPNTACARQSILASAAANSSEIKLFEKESQDILNEGTEKCGQHIGLMQLARPLDTNFIEGLKNKSQLFSDELYSGLHQLDDVAENVRNGLIAYSHMYGDIDLRVEIPRLRGGSALFNFVDHLQLKVFCEDPVNKGKAECAWMSKLKYFVFSAHDSTVNALLSALGLKERVVPDGIPEYTGAVLFELWKTSDGYKIQVNYHRNSDATMWENITPYISGCPSNTPMCPLEKFVERSKPFDPHDITTDCSKTDDLNVPSPATPVSTAELTSTTELPSTSYNSASRVTIQGIYCLLAAAFCKWSLQ